MKLDSEHCEPVGLFHWDKSSSPLNRVLKKVLLTGSMILGLVVLLTSSPALAALGDELGKLTPNDGATFDEFGYSVGIGGNRAIVGAAGNDDDGFNSGSAYLFDVAMGAQLVKLTPSDGVANNLFGVAVAISGNTAIVGAPLDDDKGSNSGSAYLFDITSGAQLAKLTPCDGTLLDYFGWSVAISDTAIIVGAVGDGDRGSAYLFEIATGAQLAKLTPSDGEVGDLFGISVGISGNTAIVGASYDRDNGLESGSAYLFYVIPEPGSLLLCTWGIVGALVWRRP